MIILDAIFYTLLVLEINIGHVEICSNLCGLLIIFNFFRFKLVISEGFQNSDGNFHLSIDNNKFTNTI